MRLVLILLWVIAGIVGIPVVVPAGNLPTVLVLFVWLCGIALLCVRW